MSDSVTPTPTQPGEAETIEGWAQELAVVIAGCRVGSTSVYMDGSHNPRPSELLAARNFVRLVAAAVRADTLNEVRREIAPQGEPGRLISTWDVDRKLAALVYSIEGRSGAGR